MKQDQFRYAMGLRLTRQARQVLAGRGIFAHSPITLQYQHSAKRYVIRGLESGGAVGDIGRYVTFAQEDGEPIECLHPVEAIGVNGVHAVVVAPALARIDMLRKGQTYELLITRHRPAQSDNGHRPPLETEVLFRGVHGRLELELSGKDKDRRGAVSPTFYSLAGEEMPISARFRQAICAITAAVNCVGCSHGHYVQVSGSDHPRSDKNRFGEIKECAADKLGEDADSALANTSLDGQIDPRIAVSEAA
jgi:hypothetical protein